MTQFFKQMSTLIGKADVNLTFRMNGDQMTILVTSKNTSKDDVLDNIKPITITGTAEELDQDFFNVVTKPLSKSAGLITNAVEFEKELSQKENETAAAKAKAEADKKEKEAKAKAEQKEKEKRDKKFNELIERAKQFESEKNSKMAYTTYKKALQFTDAPEEIQKKMNSIVAAQGSIFEQNTFTATAEVDINDEPGEEIEEVEATEEVEKGEEV